MGECAASAHGSLAPKHMRHAAKIHTLCIVDLAGHRRHHVCGLEASLQHTPAVDATAANPDTDVQYAAGTSPAKWTATEPCSLSLLSQSPSRGAARSTACCMAYAKCP